MASQIKKVLLIGGGIAGLTAGAAFGQLGIQADIIEAREEHGVLGVGIIQPGNQLRALAQIGLLDACMAAGYQSDEYRYLDANETLLASLRLMRIADPRRPAANFLRRSELQRILKAAALAVGATLRLGMTVCDLLDDGRGVDVVFSDGTKGRYDLVIGSDGIRSAMRERLFGTIAPRHTGHGCWRFTTSRPAQVTYQAILMGPGVKAGLVPLSQDSMYMLLVSNESGNPWMDPGKLHTLMRDRMKPLKGPMMSAIQERLIDAAAVVYAPIEEVILPLPWHVGRMVLIGDAAHASTPHAAQGASMAVEDAVVLAQECAKNNAVEQTLLAFEQRRYDRCKYVQDLSRQLGDEGQVNTPEAWRQRDENIRSRFGGDAAGKARPHELVLSHPI